MRSLNAVNSFSLLVAAMMLSACASSPSRTPSAMRDAATLTHWQVHGRMAVAGVESGGSGSFTWMQNGDRSTVQLRGPVGVGSLRLLIDATSLQIDTGEGQVFANEKAKLELAARLGASLPIHELRYWLIGMAAPGAHEWLASETPTDPKTLVQNDWRVEYQRVGVTEGVALPLKWIATGGRAKVRVVVDDWLLQ